MQLTITISDMACSACADKIIQAIHAIDPQAIITANPQTKLVEIDSNTPASSLKDAITNAGYTAEVLNHSKPL
jgi:copper chaperone